MTAMYKYIQKHQSPNNFQLTGTWYVISAAICSLSPALPTGGAEETNYGRLSFSEVILSNLNKNQRVNKISILVLAPKSNWSNNFGGRDGFYVIPTLALKWTLN